MRSFVFAAAEHVSLNTPVGPIDLTTPLVAVAVACVLAAIALVVGAVLLSRPRRVRAAARQRGAHADAQDRRRWHRRIDDVVSRHQAGALERGEAFAELASIARDYASEASGRDLKSHTLADIRREPRTSSTKQGLDMLRLTISALYPPEFADSAVNGPAREASVEEAAGWVSNLVERWSR
ncbi:hypothetical protein CPA40_07025 [Bifidobacterium callitrichos]|uniref:Uncharacterized protein n=1 Tax=Bifidobacterium callitrichos TaxID=762209 RepID=A0A2T3G9P3_9BIFI|nr:hypothetical protein [Bifidobacterium callitrichos]PST46188.1 hypothetical protein CPA40_07025 [Bifidobacterium callitrichos]